MGTIRNTLKQAQRAEASFDSDLELAVRFVADDLIRLKQDELFDGIGNNGKVIGRYSKATEQISTGLTGVGFPKKAGDPFNFYASGSLFKSWRYLFKDGSSLELFATDSKYDELKGRYPNMVGLSDEGEHEFNYKFLLNALRGIVKRHFT